ncbi:hypothetical protein MNV_2010016 [Candidatus Methanoperedens nitroreducens]|uniref:Uncharacterized protein n=1 Tax=Candidatus Methanoperedens nitratireducens TaxID=1392998 RepID=A0A284VNF6_9EURY|nr:hypothetical protein MNV_2010016 [Candidatus Methanoperedens nitroreducens]
MRVYKECSKALQNYGSTILSVQKITILLHPILSVSININTGKVTLSHAIDFKGKHVYSGSKARYQDNKIS